MGRCRSSEMGFRCWRCAPGDASEAHVAAVADQLAGQGAAVFALTDKVRAARILPRVRTGHGLTDALVQIAPSMALSKHSRGGWGLIRTNQDICAR